MSNFQFENRTIEEIISPSKDKVQSTYDIRKQERECLSIDERTLLFVDWLKENGCKFPKIHFPSTDTVGGIRGIT
jgi:hypothetical protein